jgi:hypothetical protein
MKFEWLVARGHNRVHVAGARFVAAARNTEDTEKIKRPQRRLTAEAQRTQREEVASG